MTARTVHLLAAGVIGWVLRGEKKVLRETAR